MSACADVPLWRLVREMHSAGSPHARAVLMAMANGASQRQFYMEPLCMLQKHTELGKAECAQALALLQGGGFISPVRGGWEFDRECIWANIPTHERKRLTRQTAP